MAARQGGDDWQDSFHPGRLPQAAGRKNPLNVHAKMDAPLGYWKRQQRIGHGQSLTMCQSEPSPHYTGKHRNREPCRRRKDESESR